MIAGIVKGYNLPIDYVLYDLSYTNLIMLGAVIPSYDKGKDKEEKEQDVIKVDDPRNKERVKEIFDQFD